MATSEELTPEDRVERFRGSIASDLYTPDTVIDFEQVHGALVDRASAISALDRLISEGMSREALANVLVHSAGAYAVVCALLSVNGSISFEDGRKLPSPTGLALPASDALAAADLLIELGIARVLTPGTSVRTILEVAEIASDASRRRFRIDAKLKARVAAIVNAAVVQAASAEDAIAVTLGSVQTLPTQARRIADYCLNVDGQPRIAIAVTFQTHSGGRQSRDLTTTYPGVQAVLANDGVSLILIADGEGIGSSSARVLRDLLTSIPHCYTLRQAADGGLAAAIMQLAEPAEGAVDETALHKLIEAGLTTGLSVSAASLPAPEDQSRLAIASFAAKNTSSKLAISASGAEIRWQRSDLVRELRAELKVFHPEPAISAITKLFDGEMTSNVDGGSTFLISQHHVFGDESFIGTLRVPFEAKDLREISRRALQICPESKSALIVIDRSLDDNLSQILRRAQATIPVNLVLVSIPQAVRVAETFVEPRRYLNQQILAQSDLAKISPYVLRGSTPSRVFYGRDEEEAALVGTLGTNSVALLGGRRIGKTSLMRHSFSRLVEADFQPFFGDCQTVRTWADFGALAKREWGVAAADNFAPKDLYDLVGELSEASARPVIFILDEIDQLLDWDKKQTDDDVPEAFFRTCRAISQSNLAQFVFAGERTIAQKLWDPSSPHWNFCRPLMLRQLAPKAAAELILEPLERLNIKIIDRDSFAQAAWRVTDGHPELLQYLGDKLVHRVNAMVRSNVTLGPADIQVISSKFEFAEQYLETYWGQSTKIEKAVGLIVVSGLGSVAEIHRALSDGGVAVTEDGLSSALHMLELYGILDQSADGYSLRAHWFSDALAHFGGAQASAGRVMGELA